LFSNSFLSCLSFEKKISYQEAFSSMLLIVNQIIEKNHSNTLWFLEHDHIYTVGASAKDNDITSNSDIPVFLTDRGGLQTYHGPGQRVVYMMLDLKKLYGPNADIRRFVADICKWLVVSLRELGVNCEADSTNIGIWSWPIDKNQDKKKIVSIGFKLKRWVTYHGVAINISPNLLNFKFIKPCGLMPNQISSLYALGYNIKFDKLDSILIKNFLLIFRNLAI